MTSIEWLIEQFKDYDFLLSLHQFDIEQAKEMHKQEIIDAYNNGDLRSADLYYQETFVSKGSDEHISDISKMVEFPQQEKTLSDKWKEYQDWLNEIPEISDEEIKNGGENAWSDYEYQEGNLYSTTFRDGWLMAIKWYKEQLKSK